MPKDLQDFVLFAAPLIVGLFAAAGIYEVIYTPLPLIYSQALVAMSIVIFAANAAGYHLYNDKLDKISALLKSVLRQTDAPQQNFNSKEAEKCIKALLGTSNAELTISRTNQKKSLAEKHNVISSALALCILGNKPLKFNKKSITTNRKIIVKFLDSIDLIPILERTNIFLQSLHKKFGNNQEYGRFLHQMLQENNFFLENLILPNLREHLETALSRFGKDLDRPERKPDRKTTVREIIYRPTISADTPLINYEIPPHIKRSDATLDTFLLDESERRLPKIIKDNPTLLEALEQCAVVEGCVLDDEEKRVELDGKKFPVFNKIFTAKAHNFLTKDDDGFLVDGKIGNVLPAIISEYQRSTEYLGQQERLENYQRFADFLNESDYIKKFSELGKIYLKGSILHSNFLGLSNYEACDTDLDICIDGLFSKSATVEEIRKTIKDNLGMEIDDTRIEVNIDLAYAHVEIATEKYGTIDLSFYDHSNKKTSTNDWVCECDALRMELTDLLQSENPITINDLRLSKLSTSRGFTSTHGEVGVDSIIEKTKNGQQEINPEARDLLINIVKRINRKILTKDQVKDLYINDAQFKKALDESWSSTLNALDSKCRKIGISYEDFMKIREEIMPKQSAKKTKQPTAIALQDDRKFLSSHD